MSRKMIALVFLLYFVAALAFGLFLVTTGPLASRNFFDPVFLGTITGTVLTAYVFPGVIPLIVWGFFGFRAERAAGPLVWWAALGIVLMALVYVGRNQEMAEQAASVTLTQKERQEFALSTKHSCVASQEQNRGNRMTGVSAEQIQSYCDCVAAGLSDALDIEEARYFVAHGSAPTSFQDKINGMELKCSLSALRKSG